MERLILSLVEVVSLTGWFMGVTRARTTLAHRRLHWDIRIQSVRWSGATVEWLHVLRVHFFGFL